VRPMLFGVMIDFIDQAIEQIQPAVDVADNV
jgi:hypothetical protein